MSALRVSLKNKSDTVITPVEETVTIRHSTLERYKNMETAVRILKSVLDINEITSNNSIHVSRLLGMSDDETVTEFIKKNLKKYVEVDYLSRIMLARKIKLELEIIIDVLYNENLTVGTRNNFLNKCIQVSPTLINEAVLKKIYDFYLTNRKLSFGVFEKIYDSFGVILNKFTFGNDLINLFLLDDGYHIQSFINMIKPVATDVCILNFDVYLKLLNQNITGITFNKKLTSDNFIQLIEHGHNEEFIKFFENDYLVENIFTLPTTPFVLAAVEHMNSGIIKFLNTKNKIIFSEKNILSWIDNLECSDECGRFLEEIFEFDLNVPESLTFKEVLLQTYLYSANINVNSKLITYITSGDQEVKNKNTIDVLDKIYIEHHDKLPYINNLKKIYPNCKIILSATF